MALIEELEQQIEELRAKLDAVVKGAELKMKSHGFRIGNLRIFQREVTSGDDRLYQEEPDGTQTDLTTAGSGGTRLQDADADTKVQVEKTSDDDTVRIDCKGNEEVTVTDTQFTCNPNADFKAGVDVNGNITCDGTVDGVDIAGRDHAQAHGPTDHTGFANWKVIYTDASGDQQEVAVGADGTVFTGTGAASAPAFEAASGHAHANDHAEAHSIASHNDTTATGTELETLTDGSDADALHDHATLATAAEAITAVEAANPLDMTNAIQVDTINEHTATAGVTIDASEGAGQGTWIKDNKVYPRKDMTDAYLTAAVNGDLYFMADATDTDALHYDESHDKWSFLIGGAAKFEIDATNTKIVSAYNHDFDAGADVTGDITVTGTVDGVDIAARDHAQAHGPSDHTAGNAWKVVYQDAAGDEQEVAVGADGTVLTGTGAASAPAFEAADEHAHANDHAESHAVASHNDTTATGTELETLTDGSNADSLHLHGEVNIDSTPADDSATGIKTELTAGTNLVWGDFCYVGADGKMEKALATAEATSRVVAFCTETVNENATGTFLLQGFIRDDSAYDFTIGAKIYLSDDTAGAHDETQPAGTDECVVILGVALTADVLYFNPTVQAIVEHTG